MKAFIYITIAACVACNEHVKTSYGDHVAISAISELSQYLGLNIDSIPGINCFTKHKVLVESDEAENLHWFSLDYKDNGKLIMSFETDWVHPDKVSRITVWTSDLKNDSIYVGQRLGVIKQLIDAGIPPSPDGELFLRLNKMSRMFLQINSGTNDSLFRNPVNLETIPDSLRIASIVIR